MTYSEIRKNEEVLTFIKKGNANLGAMGFTDHSEAHSGLVAERAAEILKKFGYPEKDIELVKIAGFMHDIGNAVNRSHHAEYGALLANDILKKTDLSLEDRVQIVSAGRCRIDHRHRQKVQAAYGCGIRRRRCGRLP